MLEPFHRFLVFAAVHLLKIDQFPFYGGQITNMFDAEQTPLGKDMPDQYPPKAVAGSG